MTMISTLSENTDEDYTPCIRHGDSDLGAHLTRFLGISDNTVLHTALASKGVISYYGDHRWGSRLLRMRAPSLRNSFRDIAMPLVAVDHSVMRKLSPTS
jgi:hypothetical protein